VSPSPPQGPHISPTLLGVSRLAVRPVGAGGGVVSALAPVVTTTWPAAEKLPEES
jgi:hypothetical protein